MQCGGRKSVFATGIGDPNAIVRLPGGTWLVSDDATDRIYRLRNGRAEVWSTSVPFPNGMALSRDKSMTVVASGMPGIASLVFGEGRFDPLSIYDTTTASGGGKIWRIPVGVRSARP